MDGNSLFFLLNQSSSGRTASPSRESVFVEHRLDEHFRRPSALPLVIVPDPRQPDFYGRVRSVLLEKAGKNGSCAVRIGGIVRSFRIEDGGERFMTVHPKPEPHRTIVPAVEMEAADWMILPPWRC